MSFNINSGYVGSKRSVRSQRAIKNYEMPISMIKKDMIREFLEDNKGEFTERDITFLQKLAVVKWKFLAKKVEPSSWHHTSSFFNETDHYELMVIAEKALEMRDER